MSKKNFLAPAVAMGLWLAASAGHAAVVTSLYSTGLNAGGTAAAAGAADAHYTVNEASGAAAHVRSALPGTYFANDANSQWIWQNADGSPVGVTRTFLTTFDLSGFDIATIVLSGLWGTDNTGLDIKLNGVSTGISLPGTSTANFQSLHAFSISSGFVAGINSLEFVIQDTGTVAAFRADLSARGDLLNSVPEPTTGLLVAAALAAAALARRKA